MSEPKRYDLWPRLQFLPGGQQAEAVLCFEVKDDGKWVAYEDYAKTKEAGQNILQHLRESSAEAARLKVEVDKLTFDPLSYLDDAGEWMPRHTHLAAVQRLKAEIELLTKQKDALLLVCAAFAEHDQP